MIKDFFIKKENIFITSIALVSIFCVVLGFLFLFLKTETNNGPRTIPSNVLEIKWKEYSSKLLDKKIQYPEYMYIQEQKESNGVGLTMSEFVPKEFLTYFSNQNHVSIYPTGIDNELFYAKTKLSDFTSSSKQEYVRIEYLTLDNKVWAVKLIPKITPKEWQSHGFIWIQTVVKAKELLCLKFGKTSVDENCDPYANQLPVYSGEVNDQFIRFGYEVVNKNTF